MKPGPRGGKRILKRDLHIPRIVQVGGCYTENQLGSFHFQNFKVSRNTLMREIADETQVIVPAEMLQ